MSRTTFLALFILICTSASGQETMPPTGQSQRAPLSAGTAPTGQPHRAPLTGDAPHSAAYRWLNKPVLGTRPLDGMEGPGATPDIASRWTSFTTSSGAVVDARLVTKIVDSNYSVATISYPTQPVHQGQHSLCMRTPTRRPGPGPATGRGWGRSGLRRAFDGEDWTGFNRLSFWVYPDLPGFYTTALDLRVYNDGQEKLPALFGQEGETSLVLRNHEWNHVVWEIGNVARDKITGFELSYGLSGSYPGEADTIQFFLDQLDLQRVDPDKIEGWDVWAGRIAYSQAGYPTGAIKTAILSRPATGQPAAIHPDARQPGATEFRVIDQATGEAVLAKPVTPTHTHLGDFDVLDFSELRTPGSYILQAGTTTTQPFRIGEDNWTESIYKALNFFYAERCGYAVPGVHDVCHGDWICVHNNRRIVVNGGWHDAGDLTQGLENTGEIDYALFSLAEKLQRTKQDPSLLDRVLEEARWGLDWILKTSFGDGFRHAGGINSRRTDNVLGTDDDLTVTARNSPMTNFEAAAVEALAYRVLKDSDPRLARQALQGAQADWQFALAALPGFKKPAGLWRGTFDSDNVEDEIPSLAILAAVNCWTATGDTSYRNKAVEFARLITGAQQRSRPDWDIPLTGFFYTSTAKDRLLHYCHRGREQGPMLALTALCSAFPKHPDWMAWYASVTLYSEYLKKIATYTEPYGVLPASIYADSEYLHVPESRMPSFKQQVLNGIPLGKGHYLRLFPVWMDYRGHFGTILPQAQGLAAAAALRNDAASADLAAHQLEWIAGRNPFAQSAMYGLGQDFAPLYTPSSGDIVGSLPVGIQTRGEKDVPYWPVQSTWTYKEIWVHPVTNWVWLLSAIAGPALVEGRADSTVVFRSTPAFTATPDPSASSAQTFTATPDPATGRFSLFLPEGAYTLDGPGGQTAQRDQPPQQPKTFLPGNSYELDLLAATAVDFQILILPEAPGKLTIRVAVKGRGRHHFTLRSDNLTVNPAGKELTLKENKEETIEWKAAVTTKNTPWVAVIYPDDDLAARKEVRGEPQSRLTPP